MRGPCVTVPSPCAHRCVLCTVGSFLKSVHVSPSWPCQQQAGPNVVGFAADLKCTFARVFPVVSWQVFQGAVATRGADGDRPRPRPQAVRLEPSGVVGGGFLCSFSPGFFPRNHLPRAPLRCTARAYQSCVWLFAHGDKRNGVARGGHAKAERKDERDASVLRCGSVPYSEWWCMGHVLGFVRAAVPYMIL